MSATRSPTYVSLHLKCTTLPKLKRAYTFRGRAIRNLVKIRFVILQLLIRRRAKGLNVARCGESSQTFRGRLPLQSSGKNWSCVLCLWFRASLIYINNCPTRCNTKQSIYYSASSFYMFRVSTTPIIRGTQNCNYSLRYWSYFLCSYLPPTWPGLATLEGGSCTKNMTSTGGCSYSFVYSWW